MRQCGHAKTHVPEKSVFYNGPMAKVFLHYKQTPRSEWVNVEVAFTRVPCVGEYISLNLASEWHRVYAVVHSLETPLEAEVYTSPASRVEAIQAGSPLPL